MFRKSAIKQLTHIYFNMDRTNFSEDQNSVILKD